MGQTTLDQYLIHPLPRIPPTKGASFLSLPRSVRRLIYAELELSLPNPIHLNYAAPHSPPRTHEQMFWSSMITPPEGTLSFQTIALSHFLDSPPLPSIPLDRRCHCIEEVWWAGAFGWGCDCEGAPYQLLYLTGAIKKEVMEMFCSENTFAVCMTDTGSLDVLYALPRKAVQRMTSLVIRLNVCECSNGFRCGAEHCTSSFSNEDMTRGHDKFVRKTEFRQFRRVMREWKRICQYLSERVLPNRLRLAFICDMVDLETAEEIIAPLFELPVLKNCSIRLGISPMGNTDIQGRLQHLAGKTALQLMGRWVDAPFRFLDLPQEIQMQILEYAGLVAKRDLCRVAAGGIPGRNPVAFVEYAAIEFQRWKKYSRGYCAARFNGIKCCGECSDAKKTCLCRSRHAAFSTTCSCWRIPTAIFQVSRKMRDDAESIFYSQNHFITQPDKDFKEFGILKFLNELPERVVKYLQHVTTNSRPLSLYESKRQIALPQWSEALDILVREGNFPRFNLTLVTSSHNRDLDEVERIEDLNSEGVLDVLMSEDWVSGKIIAKMIADRGGMRNFFFHVSWPLKQVEQDLRSRQRECEIEKMALGEDYDGVKRGKYARRHAWNGYQCGKSCALCPPQEDEDE